MVAKSKENPEKPYPREKFRKTGEQRKREGKRKCEEFKQSQAVISICKVKSKSYQHRKILPLDDRRIGSHRSERSNQRKL